MSSYAHAHYRKVVLLVTLAAAQAVATFVATRAFAQDYPSRPIRMIAPYPPGGSVDPTARVFAAYLTDKLGQQIVVDNRPGAGATGHATRMRATSEVAPIADTLPGFNNTTWYGFVAPAGTPKPIVDRLNRELNRGYADAEFNKRLIELGVEPETSTPQGLHDHIRNERERWRNVIKKAGITIGG